MPKKDWNKLIYAALQEAQDKKDKELVKYLKELLK